MAKRKTTELIASRARIAAGVRKLRLERRWTLPELAEHLDLSKSRLSEIERGGGSFTAEQFLVILRLFNVPASHFTPESNDSTVQVQNALARLGARHLFENADATPSEQLRRARATIRAALVDGSPRVLTAIAPVLVRNIEQLSPAGLSTDAWEVGYENRLGWVVENTLVAIPRLAAISARDTQNLRVAEVRLRLVLQHLEWRKKTLQESSPEDLLERSVRTQKTLERLLEKRSTISRKWKVVSSITPEEFLKALRDGLEVD